MWGRKKNKKPLDKSIPSISDKVAVKIARAIHSLQLKFSIIMNNIFARLSSAQLKALLIVFCFLSGGFSIYLFGDAIFGKSQHEANIRIDQINIPKHFNRTGEDAIQQEYMVDQETFLQIMQFKSYMDSLMKSPSGKLVYDSIMVSRPGLMDSVLLLESIYRDERLPK